MINLKDIFFKKAIQVEKEIDHAEIVLKNAEDKLRQLKEAHPIDLLRSELEILILDCNYAHEKYGLYLGANMIHYGDERYISKTSDAWNNINQILDEMVKVVKEK